MKCLKLQKHPWKIKMDKGPGDGWAAQPALYHPPQHPPRSPSSSHPGCSPGSPGGCLLPPPGCSALHTHLQAEVLNQERISGVKKNIKSKKQTKQTKKSPKWLFLVPAPSDKSTGREEMKRAGAV